MMCSIKLRIVLFLTVLIVKLASGQRIVIDTNEDLIGIPGWEVSCDRGYQKNVTDFQCHNHIGIEMPGEELSGEVGFWVGCFENCVLTYTIKSTDAGIGFRAYLQDSSIVVIHNDTQHEYISGTKWVDVDYQNFEPMFPMTVGFSSPLITRDSFVLLDKIFVDPGVPTTTTNTPSTSTILTSTSSTPPERTVIDINTDIPDNGNWNFDCPFGYAYEPSDYLCSVGEVNFPPEDLNDVIGFWTKCRSRCVITYYVQPEDVNFTARVYQMNSKVGVSVDQGLSWRFIDGERWVEFSENLAGSGYTEVSLLLDHSGPDYFVLVDKIFVNYIF